MVSRPPAKAKYASGASDDLDFEACYVQATLSEMRSEHQMDSLIAELKRIEIDQHRELRRADMLFQRLPEVVSALEKIPQVEVDGTIQAMAHMIVIKVDLPSRYVRYFIRSKVLPNDEEKPYQQLGIARLVAGELLDYLDAIIPKTYYHVCGSGYSQVKSYSAFDLYSDYRLFGCPPWPHIIPLIQEVYRNYHIRIRHSSDGDWEVISRKGEWSDKHKGGQWHSAAEISTSGGAGSASPSGGGRQRSPSYIPYVHPANASGVTTKPRRYSLLPQDEVPLNNRRRYSVNYDMPLTRRRSSFMASAQ